jgi:pseudouridine-5'-phosphate glycosidase
VKSILDVPATLQRLETLGVGVLGYGTARFPGFYLTDSGEPVDWTVHSSAEVAAVMAAQDALGGHESALIVANPVAAERQLDPALHDRVLRESLAEALAAADREEVTGQAITPFLLAYLTEHTDGASLEANLAAVRGNVALAAAIAADWADRSR